MRERTEYVASPLLPDEPDNTMNIRLGDEEHVIPAGGPHDPYPECHCGPKLIERCECCRRPSSPKHSWFHFSAPQERRDKEGTEAR